MKARESGMPLESVWRCFFNPKKILGTFGIDKETEDVVEFGCGYGTFTLAAANLISGNVFAFDIDPDMVALVQEKCDQQSVSNVVADEVDFVAGGTGLANGVADAALLFNILHLEDPVALLREAFRILRPGGKALVMHWNYDPETPRGPSMEIRPRPDQCIQWGIEAGFIFFDQEKHDFKPYHYGMVLRKPLLPG